MATYQSTSSAQSGNPTYPVPKPPGTAQGDILVAFQTSAGVALSGMPTPLGGSTWQLLGQLSPVEDWSGGKVWWKVAGPDEPATYTFRQDGDEGITGIVCVTDASDATPLIASLSDDAGTQILCPAVSPSTDSGVTIRWGAILDQGKKDWTPPSGHTERMERSETIFLSAAIATRARTTTGSTGTAAFTIAPFKQPPAIAFTVDVGGFGGPVQPPPDPVPPSADIHYIFKFCDLATDAFITNLDLDQVTYTRTISEPGTFSATIEVANAEIADQVAKVVPRWADDPFAPDSLSTGPGRTCCHVYRNGIIWGTYAIWKATVSSDGRGAIKVSLSGATLESYLNAVEIRSTLTYTAQDQLDIARDLITSMQALSHANIGLSLESNLSGVNRDRTYAAGETATFGQRLKELADTDDGFEYLIHTSDPGTGARVRLVKLGYPTLGTTANHMFSQPGNVLAWSQDTDGLRGATSYRARGESISTDASTTSTPLISTPADATAHLAAGWVRVDKTVDYSTVKEVDTLNAYATRWATERPGAVRIHQVDVRLDDTEWTPANLGDQARVVLVNDWWPIRDGGASFNYRWRVIGVSVRATSRNSQEVATLTFEEEVDI